MEKAFYVSLFAHVLLLSLFLLLMRQQGEVRSMSVVLLTPPPVARVGTDAGETEALRLRSAARTETHAARETAAASAPVPAEKAAVPKPVPPRTAAPNKAFRPSAPAAPRLIPDPKTPSKKKVDVTRRKAKAGSPLAGSFENPVALARLPARRIDQDANENGESMMNENLRETNSGARPHGDGEPLERRLSDSLDIEITLDELEELKQHLQGCPPCLEFVESLKTTVKLCHDFGVEQSPAPLSEDIRSEMVSAYAKMLEKRKAQK